MENGSDEFDAALAEFIRDESDKDIAVQLFGTMTENGYDMSVFAFLIQNDVMPPHNIRDLLASVREAKQLPSSPGMTSAATTMEQALYEVASLVGQIRLHTEDPTLYSQIGLSRDVLCSQTSQNESLRPDLKNALLLTIEQNF